MTKLIFPVGIITLWLATALATSAAGVGKAPIKLRLPSRVTISLVNGRVVSGVRLLSLQPNQVNYKKAGIRTLPLRQVLSISFRDETRLKERIPQKLRGGDSDRCQEEREISLISSALEILDSGEILALFPDKIKSDDLQYLRKLSNDNKTFVSVLSFNSLGRVRIKLLSCPFSK